MSSLGPSPSSLDANPKLIRLAACAVAAPVFVWQEQKEFAFPPLPFAVVVLELVALSVCLCLFRRGPSRLQPPKSAAAVVRFIGRRTLLIYAVQLAGSELLVRVLPDDDDDDGDSLAPPPSHRCPTGRKWEAWHWPPSRATIRRGR